MPLDQFPPSPNPGDVYKDWTWEDGANGRWVVTGEAGGAVFIGSSAPDPRPGRLWWDTVGAQLYLWDGAQWVVVTNQPGASGGEGVTDGSNAAPGMIGEFLQADNNASPINMLNNQFYAVTQLTVTPGDWDVMAQFAFAVISGSIAGTMNTLIHQGGSGVPLNILGGDLQTANFINIGASAIIYQWGGQIPVKRANFSASTQVSAAFSQGGATSSNAAGRIWARRAR